MAPTPETTQATLEKRGVRVTRNRRPLNFIGKNADKAFAKLAASFAVRISEGDSDFASIGGFYENGIYARVNGKRSYEPVYGDDDYSVSIGDSGVQQVLTEAFGDKDGKAGTETGLDSVRAALGSANALPNTLSLPERGRGAAIAQDSVADVRDEELVGVRLAGDYDAPIESVA